MTLNLTILSSIFNIVHVAYLYSNTLPLMMGVVLFVPILPTTAAGSISGIIGT